MSSSPPPPETTPEPEPALAVCRPPFRLSMRSAFIAAAFCFGLLLAVPLAWFNYARNTQAALEVAGELARQAGDIVALRTSLLVKPLDTLGEHAHRMPGAATPPRGVDHPLTPVFLDLRAESPQLYSLYFGYPNGDFLQIIPLAGNPKLHASLRAPHGARYALRRIEDTGGRRLERWRFLDASRRVLADSPPKIATYDPRKRPWFAAASQVDGTLRSRPYVFSSTGALGLTLSRRVRGPQPAVFGVDMTLEDLSRFLAREKVGPSGTLFVFDADGTVLGHPDPAKTSLTGPDGKPALATVESLGDPRALAVLQRLRAGGDKGFGLSPCAWTAWSTWPRRGPWTPWVRARNSWPWCSGRTTSPSSWPARATTACFSPCS